MYFSQFLTQSKRKDRQVENGFSVRISANPELARAACITALAALAAERPHDAWAAVQRALAALDRGAAA